MSRKLICDFCSTEFPDHDADVDTSKTLNWVEQLDKATDICAECAMTVVHNLVDHGDLSAQTILDFYHADFTRRVAFVNPPKAREVPDVDSDLDLDFDPEDIPMDFGPDDVAAAAGEAAKVVAARSGKLFDPDPDATPDDVFRLTMHGAGLNPEHELLFQTLDEAKDYAAKNVQVFPEAAYHLQCPDGTSLQGNSNVAWTNPHALLDPSEVRVNWKVATQPKKA